jgi:hypothetical protein
MKKIVVAATFLFGVFSFAQEQSVSFKDVMTAKVFNIVEITDTDGHPVIVRLEKAGRNPFKFNEKSEVGVLLNKTLIAVESASVQQAAGAICRKADSNSRARSGSIEISEIEVTQDTQFARLRFVVEGDMRSITGFKAVNAKAGDKVMVIKSVGCVTD